MADLVRFHDHPPVHEPVLLLALEGWFDAGASAAGAAQAVLDDQADGLLAEFDIDRLLDLRARRPIVTLEEGVVSELKWPAIELRVLADANGRHVVVLVGAEPDHAWGPFVDVVRATALDLGATMVVGLGAYPAPTPHTRDSLLALTSPSEELLDSFPGYVRGTIAVPAGAQTAIEVATHESGIPTLGLWAQVPHYISGIPYPAGSLALLDGLEQVAGIDLPREQLRTEAAASRLQLDELVAGNPQHRQMVEQLEELYDSQDLTGLGPLPTGDELAAEVQAFLREQRD